MAGVREPIFVEKPAAEAPWEQGFAALFQAEIAPGLQAQETQRLRAVALFWKLEAGVLALATVLALVLYLSDAHWLVLALLIPGLALFFGWAVAKLPRLIYREGLRELVLPPLCRFLGDLTYTRRGGAGTIEPARLSAIGMIPPASRIQLEDHFAGRWSELPFEMVELRLLKESGRTSGGSRSTRTAYRGLLLKIGVPLSFAGTVVIRRDFGRLGNQLVEMLSTGSGLKVAPVPHEAFEKQFEVASDAQADLPALLTPPVLEALLQLDRAQGGKGLTGAFLEGAFYLALPVKRDLFEFGGLFRSVYRIVDDLHDLLFQATLPRRVIDALHGQHPAKVI